MTTAFGLIHSPIVGPYTWMAVAGVLRRGDTDVTVPDLDGDERDPTPLWRQHARAAADGLHGNDLILVAHSGAGALLPPIGERLRGRVAGYIFVDAGLPWQGPRKGHGEFARLLERVHARGRRYPDWGDTSLSGVVPDPARRRALLADVRPQPPRFWDEVVPVFDTWPDAPCAYIRFGGNPAYEAAARVARDRGWPYREIPGDHFHMLVDEEAVAAALRSLAAQLTR